MKFFQQSMFAYDPGLSRVELEAILDHRVTLSDTLVMSGVEDFRLAFDMVREYYSNYPVIEFRELKTNIEDDAIEVDPLWSEPSSLKLEFSRVLKLRAILKLGEEKKKVTKEGAQRTYDLRAHIGLPSAFDSDYWPKPGDELLFRGVIHSITHVHVLPTDYFQNTGIPIHLTIDTAIKQHSGLIPHQNSLTKLGRGEEGKPVQSPPESSHNAIAPDWP